MNFVATLAPVTPPGEDDRGSPPVEFLTEFVTLLRKMPDSLYAPNQERYDIFDDIACTLGPWLSPLHRKASLAEVLRVLSGFESSWNWNCGADSTNETETDPYNASAGMWQVAANSQYQRHDLQALIKQYVSSKDYGDFQKSMKEDHEFALLYTTAFLRHTYRANGPIVSGKILPCLSRDAVKEFMGMLG